MSGINGLGSKATMWVSSKVTDLPTKGDVRRAAENLAAKGHKARKFVMSSVPAGVRNMRQGIHESKVGTAARAAAGSINRQLGKISDAIADTESGSLVNSKIAELRDDFMTFKSDVKRLADHASSTLQKDAGQAGAAKLEDRAEREASQARALAEKVRNKFP